MCILNMALPSIILTVAYCSSYTFVGLYHDMVYGSSCMFRVLEFRVAIPFVFRDPEPNMKQPTQDPGMQQ